jgi:hypothetical protein
MTREEFDQGMIGEWFMSPFPSSPNQEDGSFMRVGRTLMHHILAQGRQGFWLMQINNSLAPRFGPHAFGMIRAVANDHTPTPILDILQVQIENLSWSEPSLKHEKNHRFVA